LTNVNKQPQIIFDFLILNVNFSKTQNEDSKNARVLQCQYLKYSICTTDFNELQNNCMQIIAL